MRSFMQATKIIMDVEVKALDYQELTTQIVVRVQLPSGVKRYKLSSLSPLRYLKEQVCAVRSRPDDIDKIVRDLPEAPTSEITLKQRLLPSQNTRDINGDDRTLEDLGIGYRVPGVLSGDHAGMAHSWYQNCPVGHFSHL